MEVGWKYSGVIEKLEKKRKEKSAIRYSRRRKDDKLKLEAKKALGKKIASHQAVIRSFGYEA